MCDIEVNFPSWTIKCKAIPSINDHKPWCRQGRMPMPAWCGIMGYDRSQKISLYDDIQRVGADYYRTEINGLFCSEKMAIQSLISYLRPPPKMTGKKRVEFPSTYQNQERVGCLGGCLWLECLGNKKPASFSCNLPIAQS